MILIVEDNNEINSLIYEALTRKGYECKQAYSGTEALLLFNNEEIDLIILDLMLPGMSGEEVLKKIREKSNVIVVVISAKNELDTKIDLFEIGADDYITKPFEIKELEAKIGAWIRRSGISNVLEDKNIRNEVREMRLRKVFVNVKAVMMAGFKISVPIDLEQEMYVNFMMVK